MDEPVPVKRSGLGAVDVRFEGLCDLLLRARGASVFDVGCNRAHVVYEFYRHGARVVHGCDIHAPSIMAARHWFAELAECESKFEVVNLEHGPSALRLAFGDVTYDIVLFLGVYHKLKRAMRANRMGELLAYVAGRAQTYFAWTGYTTDKQDIDLAMAPKMKLIHSSEIAAPGRIAAIWKRLS